MKQGPGPIQSKIIKALKDARTSEPYPVWMTWKELACRTYGYSSDRDTLNVRRTASKLHQVVCVYYAGGKHAGAHLRMTPEEGWIETQVLRTQNQLCWPVDFHRYRRPTKEEMVAGFLRGLQDNTISVDVAKVVEIINGACGTSFDPSEAAWWRVGFEQRMMRERRELLAKMHNLLRNQAAEKRRCEVEARLIAIRVDPDEAPDQCPCCRQWLTPEAKDLWLSQHRAALFGPRKPLSSLQTQ